MLNQPKRPAAHLRLRDQGCRQEESDKRAYLFPETFLLAVCSILCIPFSARLQLVYVHMLLENTRLCVPTVQLIRGSLSLLRYRVQSFTLWEWTSIRTLGSGSVTECLNADREFTNIAVYNEADGEIDDRGKNGYV